MLTVYRRHKTTCKFKDDRISKKCRCALWAKGTLEGEPYQKSLKTRSFERAQQIIREIEDGKRQQEEKQVSIKEALHAFVSDCEARNLNHSTLRKYKTLQATLALFSERKGITLLGGLGSTELREYRGERNLAPRTASKELERLRAFFNFCVENEWIKKSPAKSIKAPELKPNPTLPFSASETEKLLLNTDERSRVFFRLLLHSGLRIIDAAQLRPEKIVNGRLFLYAQKTGTPVFVPLPPDLLADLERLPLVGGFFFATESDNPVSIAEYYRQKLLKAATAAGLMTKRKKGDPKRKNAIHPHRFRDTFAVRLLEKGVPLETVSILLGHTDIKTTQRSYAPWVQSLQDNLERAVAQTWEKPKLRLVKG